MFNKVKRSKNQSGLLGPLMTPYSIGYFMKIGNLDSFETFFYTDYVEQILN